MKKHFVTFYSPGTIVSETTTKPIDAWDVDAAVAMARTITERHGATPYGFQFSTRERGDGDLDSHETDRSGTYFLGGAVLTLADIKARNEPSDSILISNMEANGFACVVENRNSWRATLPLNENDTVLEYEPTAIA